jgi:hypothetical protein
MQENITTMNNDRLEIDNLVRLFFAIFTNTNHKQPDWSIIDDVCIPETIIIKKEGEKETVYSLQSFIEPRRIILINGTITDFEERETNNETNIIRNLAQRCSRYEKTGYLNGNYFQEYGNKLFQLINTSRGWKINSIIWEDDKP